MLPDTDYTDVNRIFTDLSGHFRTPSVWQDPKGSFCEQHTSQARCKYSAGVLSQQSCSDLVRLTMPEAWPDTSVLKAV
jgi:hypothetical protein